MSCVFAFALFSLPQAGMPSPQIIHGPRLACMTQSSITIFWETDEPSRSLVRYGLTALEDSTFSTALDTFHVVTIENLETSSVYNYQVESSNDQGRVTSQEYTFRTAVSENEPFRFASMSDSQNWGEDEPLPEVFTWIVRRALGFQPHLVLFGGDNVYGSSDSFRLREQWDEWISVTDTLAHYVPIYQTIGNHEANCYSQNYDGGIVFVDECVLPTNGPPGYQELVYSFDYGNAHFVCLDSDVYDNQSRIDEVQRAWLKTDLETTDKLHRFAFAHEHAFTYIGDTYQCLETYPYDRNAFWEILYHNHVDAYICGHIHLWNQDFFGRTLPDTITSVHQIINGTCGGPIVAGHGGDFYHFVIWDIDGPHVDGRVFDNYGHLKDSFSFDVNGIDGPKTPMRTREAPAIHLVPNPMHTACTIRWFASRVGSGGTNPGAEAAIYDLTGRLIQVLPGKPEPRRGFLARWDGYDLRSQRAPNGIYLVTVTPAAVQSAQKLILIR